MFLRRFFQTNRDAEADRSSLENDRTPTYTSNVTTAPTHTDGVDRLSDRTRAWNVSDLSGCDSVTLPESSGSPTDTLGVTTPRYSKRPSGKFKFFPPVLICVDVVSILPDLC